MSKKTHLWALDNVRFDSDAGGDMTCREYLCTLLQTLWDEKEGFSGKRPFGNSGWDADIMEALAGANCIKCTKDDYGVIPDKRDGDLFVSRMIAEMMEPR